MGSRCRDEKILQNKFSPLISYYFARHDNSSNIVTLQRLDKKNEVPFLPLHVAAICSLLTYLFL